MPAHRTLALALAALLALSAGAAAGAHGENAADPDDHAQAETPDAALFGLCTAWANAHDTPGDGDLASVPPFMALEKALCEDVEHPGDANAQVPDEAADQAHDAPPFVEDRPDHAGDEDEAEDGDASDEDGDDSDEHDASDEHRPEDAGKPDHAGPP